jgi:hypothetical protein
MVRGICFLGTAMDFRERDPTNPLTRKFERDRELREAESADEHAASAEEVTIEDRAISLEALERKYSGDRGDIEEGIDFGAAEVKVTADKAREWGKRDGSKAVELAKEEASSELEGIEVVGPEFARALGVPHPDEPGSPARRLCSQWDYVTQGISFAPTDIPLNGLISKEAGYCYRASEGVADVYWDALELELRRSNVQLLPTYYVEPYENTYIYSLYVIDLDRFPVWNGKNIEGINEEGSFVVEETCVQMAYMPEKPGIKGRLGSVFRRSR